MPITRKYKSKVLSIRWHKVIPAVVTAGMTFFLLGCQLPAPVREVPEDQFQAAEDHRQRGEWEEALAAYQDYLDRKPGKDRTALTLHRMAQTWLEMGRSERAFETLERIRQEFPGYEGISQVQLDLARSLCRMGRFESCRAESLQWIRLYPNHPLRGDALEILGDSSMAMGDRAEAFRWWLEARKAWVGDLQREWALNEKLMGLISESPLDVLEAIVPYAQDTEYAPELHHRRALLYLEKNELERARAAAMSLVRATPDPYWVSVGGDLLEQIREELSVRTGALGCLLPLSGPFAIYGREVLRGIELGMGLFDPTGWNPVDELVIQDTRDRPEDAVAALEHLVEREKVIAVVGPLSSKTAMPVARRAQELGVPLLTLTQHSEVTGVGDMVFRNFLTPSREVDRLVSAADGDMGIKRFAILYPKNSYGRFLMDRFWEALEAMGGTVTAIESYGPDETDFAEQIKKLTGLYYPRPPQVAARLENARCWEEEESVIGSKDPQPIVDFDAVFIPDNFERVAMVAPQLVFYNVLDVQLLGTSLWQGAPLVDLTGEYVQGAVFSSGFFEESEVGGVDSFVKDYRSNFGSDPGVLAATGYDTMRLVKQTLAAGGIRTRRDLREHLVNGDGFQGVTGRMVFNEQGEVQKQPFLLRVSGNRITMYRW